MSKGGIDVEDILKALPPEGRTEFVDKLKRESGVEIAFTVAGKRCTHRWDSAEGKELLKEVDPDLNIVSRSQYRRGNTPAIQELYNIAEEQEKRIERIERILQKLPEDVIEMLDVQAEEELTGEDHIKVINQLRALEERQRIRIHSKIKLSNVVLAIINQNYLCLKPDNSGIACPCDDPLAHGCNFFIPLESEIQVSGMLQESCTR